MAGHGKKKLLGKPDTFRRHKIRIRNEARNKRKRNTEEIEISSSLLDQNQRTEVKGNQFSQTLTQEPNRIHDEVTLNEMKKIRHAVNKLTMMMMNYNRISGSTAKLAGEPILIPEQESTQTSRIGDRSTKSDPCVKQQGLWVKNSKAKPSGPNIPMWMPVVFRPPRSMIVNELEAKLAAFIFSREDIEDLPGDELLVRSKWIVGDRAMLKTFMPTKHLHPNVIGMIVSRLTYNEQLLTSDSISWFLPTKFAVRTI
ncbi:hypothetical protein SESBI_47996 [Sesbania bispinosa]|nr:hypothetical protein SESBI_47996 [Sesbania bispinosa]